MKYSVAFVAGGTGPVGSGFVRSLLQEGAKVAVSSRSQQRLDDLKKSFSSDLQKKLILIAENVGKEEGAKKILKILQEKHGGVHHVMSGFGGWWMGGPLTDQSVEEFDKHIDDRARTHFICCKTFLPVLAKKKGTTYTFISGTSFENVFRPDISLLAVGNFALVGISTCAQVQYKDSNVAVNEVRIGIFVQPKLDKELPSKTMEFTKGQELEVIGHDAIGNFLVDLNKIGYRGLIRITSRKDVETQHKELQKKL